MSSYMIVANLFSNNVHSKITKLGRLSVTSLTHCDFTSPMPIVGSVYHRHLTLVSYGRVYGAVIAAMSYSWEVMYISGIHLWNFWWGHQIYLTIYLCLFDSYALKSLINIIHPAPPPLLTWHHNRHLRLKSARGHIKGQTNLIRNDMLNRYIMGIIWVV